MGRPTHASSGRIPLAIALTLAAILLYPGPDPARAAEPDCGLVWRDGAGLYVLKADGGERELVRAPADIQAWAISDDGHVAWAAGGRLYALPAGADEPVRLRHRRLRQGRFDRPIALRFAGRDLVVTLVDPGEEVRTAWGERARVETTVRLPRRLRSEAAPATLPTAVLCAGLDTCESPRRRSPSGRFLMKAVSFAAHGERFVRLSRIEVGRVEKSAVLVDLLDFNRAQGACTKLEQRRCAEWEIVGWGWLPGDHAWAKLRDLTTGSHTVSVILPADAGEAVADCADLEQPVGNPEGTRWVLGCLVCCEDGRCQRLPEEVFDGRWLPQVR